MERSKKIGAEKASGMRFDDVTVIVRFHAFFSPFKNNACYVPGAPANPRPRRVGMFVRRVT